MVALSPFPWFYCKKSIIFLQIGIRHFIQVGCRIFFFLIFFVLERPVVENKRASSRPVNRKGLFDSVQKDVVEFVFAENLSLELLESPFFRRITDRIVESGAPTRKTACTSILNELHRGIREVMDQDIRACMNASIDCWWCADESIFAVVMHYLDVNFNAKSAILDFRKLQLPATGHNLNIVLSEILSAYPMIRFQSGIVHQSAAAIRDVRACLERHFYFTVSFHGAG